MSGKLKRLFLSQGHAFSDIIIFGGWTKNEMTNITWIYSNGVSIQLYIRKKCTSNNKYAFKGDLGILSQGHALTISGNLTVSG